MDQEKRRLIVIEPEGFSKKALTDLAGHFEIVLGPYDREALLKQMSSANAIFVRLGHMIDFELLGAASLLEYIVTPTTGLNHIDMEYAVKNKITVLSLRGEDDLLSGIFSTAELTWGLLINLSRKINAANNHVLSGHWNRDLFRGTDLAGKTLGIVGFGRLGNMVANYAVAFGMRVLYYDPMVTKTKNLKVEDLSELCTESDVISIHVSLNSSTKNLFGAHQFSQMRRASLLLNTSRGDVIDEWALIDALSSGKIAGAALDVLRDETDPHCKSSSHLRNYASQNANLILTPHIGGATISSMNLTEEHMANILIEHIDQEC